MEPLNKGDNINSAVTVVYFVERLSSLRRFKMYCENNLDLCPLVYYIFGGSTVDSALEDTVKPLVTTLQIRPLMVIGIMGE